MAEEADANLLDQPDVFLDNEFHEFVLAIVVERVYHNVA